MFRVGIDLKKVPDPAIYVNSDPDTNPDPDSGSESGFRIQIKALHYQTENKFRDWK